MSVAASSVPESSSPDLDDCIPLACSRDCRGHTVDDDDCEDTNCEQEAGGLRLLSSASTPDISAKERVGTITGGLLDLSKFPSLQLMLKPLNLGFQVGLVLSQSLNFLGVHCRCCCVISRRPKGHTILLGIL